MNMRALYKSHHSYLRRALNAGGRGYLTSDAGFRGDARNVAARKAACAVLRASGRQPASKFDNRLFWHHSYIPGRARAREKLVGEMA